MQSSTVSSASRGESIHGRVRIFRNISKYFSTEEWSNLSKWHKNLYWYMKQNYVRMTGLGVKVNVPVFMRPKEQATESAVTDSDESEDEMTEGNYGVSQTKYQKMQKEAESEENQPRSTPRPRRSRVPQRRRHTRGRGRVATGTTPRQQETERASRRNRPESLMK